MSLTDEQILKLICDNTGKRINLPNFTLDELKDFARAAVSEYISSQKPVAWIRKCVIDGEVPKKEINIRGRMAWPIRFKLHAVTKGKALDDDIALFTNQ